MVTGKSRRKGAKPKEKQEDAYHINEGSLVCFQDVMTLEPDDDQSDDQEFAANALFELANAPIVGYRIDTNSTLRIHQDHRDACGQHTGGIVWETSFLLLNYLRQTSSSQGKKYPCGKNVLEVGAGCGLLGLGIYHSKLAKRVILTETDLVLPNLQRNVDQNSLFNKHADRLCVGSLDWTRCQHDCEKANIKTHSIDMIVGTDVVFSIRFVRPLLETIQYLAHEQTRILLCLQERCPDSHKLLLDSAKDFGLIVHDISQQVTEVPTCEWGKVLDCRVLELHVATNGCDNAAVSSPKLKKMKMER